ncbi:hypothetical protein ACQPZX_29400 [Actinoplanes sp. CA-142083]|uniref:hypothetical protein n=1 Tax=Actinoplanes sp. CA-142083 TaxID=3239903 RepID=UPI003D943212
MTSPDPALAAILTRLRGDGSLTGPAPLPDVREDRSYTQALAAKETYTAAAAQARNDSLQHPAVRAAAVVKAYNACIQTLATLHEDLESRRRTRQEWIETQLPIGPGIAPGTTPADRTVLLAAFNAALAKARETGTAGRASMLADAERFGDEAVRRAVFTASYDVSEWQLLDRWIDSHSPATRGLVDEWRTLQNLLLGYTGEMQLRFEQMAFAQPPKPSEVYELPRLVETFNATVRAHNGSQAVRSGQARAQNILDLGQLLT